MKEAQHKLLSFMAFLSVLISSNNLVLFYDKTAVSMLERGAFWIIVASIYDTEMLC